MQTLRHTDHLRYTFTNILYIVCCVYNVYSNIRVKVNSGLQEANSLETCSILALLSESLQAV